MTVTETNLNNPTNIDKVLQETQNEINVEETKKERKPRKKKELEPVKTVKVSAKQYEQVFEGLIGFSGIYLSKVAKWEGFTLTEEETKLLASQASDLAVEFMPTVESKYVKIGAFSMTLIAVFGMRYMQFAEIQKQRLANSQTMGENNTHEIQTN